MKHLPPAGLLLSALFLCACANDPGRDVPRTLATTGPCERVDCERMHRIDRHARARGVHVIWVNPPQKRPLEKAETVSG